MQDLSYWTLDNFFNHAAEPAQRAGSAANPGSAPRGLKGLRRRPFSPRGAILSKIQQLIHISREIEFATLSICNSRIICLRIEMFFTLSFGEL